jgi:hypothetical protein
MLIVVGRSNIKLDMVLNCPNKAGNDEGAVSLWIICLEHNRIEKIYNSTLLGIK